MGAVKETGRGNERVRGEEDARYGDMINCYGFKK